MLDNEYLILLISNVVFHVAQIIWVSDEKTTIEVNYSFFVEYVYAIMWLYFILDRLNIKYA